MKSFTRVAVVGVTGLVAFKLFAGLAFPLFGMLVGLVMLAVKYALIAAVIYFVYSIFRTREEEKRPEDEIIVEVEVEEVEIVDDD